MQSKHHRGKTLGAVSEDVANHVSKVESKERARTP
jgi:hypothetical protein